MIIPTYIINLKKRSDRKEHILAQFNNRNEFNINIVEAIEDEVGAVGLYKTIKHIIQDLVPSSTEYILICEDDHEFTENYTKGKLITAIAEAKEKKAYLLSGGTSWFNTAFQISDNLFWVDQFSGLQFTIIFRSLFHFFLTVNFKATDAIDVKISEFSNQSFFIYPLLSIQKDFGYSDATSDNNISQRVGMLFKNNQLKINLINDVYKQFNKNSNRNNFNILEYLDISIPLYVINLPERSDRKKHIENQFLDRNEFDVTIVEACKDKIGAVGLWKSICKIIKMAIDNDDDVIIICEDDHEFTPHYNKEFLLKSILEANNQGVEILSGGISGFNLGIPITMESVWISDFYGTQFIVLFSSAFNKLLDESFDNNVTADDIISEVIVNKMVMYPFISIQKEFGYSDVTKHNNEKGLVSRWFVNTEARLKKIFTAYERLRRLE